MKKVTTSQKNVQCPMIDAMKVIGGKWKILIIYYLSEQEKRFSELQRDLPQVTTKMLTQQLRELESDGILIRKVYPVVPPKVEYKLSKKGEALLPIVADLNKWGQDFVCEN